jgi:Spy/CpxP family protein refolding chaperone
MKRLLFVLTLGAALALPAFAQSTDSTNAPPPGEGGPGGHHDHMKFLTDAEKAELHKAHDAAIAADPGLATEEKAQWDDMKASHEAGTPPTDEQKEKMHALHDEIDAAMIKADPAVAPIIEKIKAHHHGPGGPDGAGGPPPPPAQ